jgi:RNA polymerase sigma factor (sigma-70 family)
MQKEKLCRKWIDENGRKIYRICCWYCDEPEERNDAYQEALIRIWEQLHSFKGQSNISTWIYRVTVNSCLLGIRRDKRRRSYLDPERSAENLEISDPIVEKEPSHDEKLQGCLKPMSGSGSFVSKNK